MWNICETYSVRCNLVFSKSFSLRWRSLLFVFCEAVVSAGDLRQMALACGRAQCFDGDLMEAPLIWKNLQWLGTCWDKVRMSFCWKHLVLDCFGIWMDMTWSLNSFDRAEVRLGVYSSNWAAESSLELRCMSCPEAMVPLIEERLQDFRPKELVQIADAYVAWWGLLVHKTGDSLRERHNILEWQWDKIAIYWGYVSSFQARWGYQFSVFRPILIPQSGKPKKQYQERIRLLLMAGYGWHISDSNSTFLRRACRCGSELSWFLDGVDEQTKPTWQSGSARHISTVVIDLKFII